MGPYGNAAINNGGTRQSTGQLRRNLTKSEKARSDPQKQTGETPRAWLAGSKQTMGDTDTAKTNLAGGHLLGRLTTHGRTMQQQLELKPKPTILNAYPWARPHRDGVTYGVVLAVPLQLPYGLADWLRENNWQSKAVAADRGQYAALLVGGCSVELLGWVPRPESHGSLTAGNYLPW